MCLAFYLWLGQNGDFQTPHIWNKKTEGFCMPECWLFKYGSRLKGYKVKFKISIFIQLKVPGKSFLGKEEEAVEVVS